MLLYYVATLIITLGGHVIILCGYVIKLCGHVIILGGGRGVVVGFNGGKYAIPDRINNISVWKDRAEGCLWWPRTGKLETIMTFKSKVIFF